MRPSDGASRIPDDSPTKATFPTPPQELTDFITDQLELQTFLGLIRVDRRTIMSPKLVYKRCTLSIKLRNATPEWHSTSVPDYFKPLTYIPNVNFSLNLNQGSKWNYPYAALLKKLPFLAPAWDFPWI